MVQILFSFSIFTLVTRGIMESTSEDFLWCLLALPLVCFFICVLFTPSDIDAFDLSIEAQGIQIIEIIFYLLLML